MKALFDCVLTPIYVVQAHILPVFHPGKVASFPVYIPS